jgi:hypothetical protein
MQRADAGISAPRKDQFARATHSDHLIVNEIRRHPDEREIFKPRTNDLVAGGKGDQMRKTLERDDVAGMHVSCDGFGEAKSFAH